MRAIADIGNMSPGRSIGTDIPVRRGPSLLARAMEMLGLCSRASTAAYHYDQLKSLSNAELAVRNLERADLPRAAFDKLTDTW